MSVDRLSQLNRLPTAKAGAKSAAAVRWYRAPILLLCTILLSGCTTFREYVHNGFKVGPNYGRAPAPVATDWIDSTDVRLRPETPDLAHWWTVFNDPILNTLVAEAYSQNLTLREAGFRVLQARATLAIAQGMLFPQQQDAFGGYSRNAISQSVANSSFIPTKFFDQYDAGFNLAWEIDFWGRFRRAIESAEADLDASVENYDDVIVTLVGDVATTYVQMRTLSQQLAYTQENVVLQQQTLDIANARFKGGTTSELDVDQSVSTLAQTQAQIPQLRIRIRQATNRLCILLGMPPEDLLPLLGNQPIPVAPSDAIVGIPAEMLLRRPDVRRAERIAASQCAQIGVAVSQLYPHIGVTGTIGVASEQFNTLFQSQSLVGSVGPSFQWNVLNYGRLINNIRLQDARFQELVVRYQQQVLLAGEEAENAMVSFLQSQEQAQYLNTSVVAAEKAVRIAVVQYRAGTTDFNRVALVQQNLVQQQDQLAQSRGNISLGLIQVYRALGGGWQLRLSPLPPVMDVANLPADQLPPNAIAPPANNGGQPVPIAPNTIAQPTEPESIPTPPPQPPVRSSQ
ncbi:MAG: efflux transporter outer membrane subunit [Planctomycetota bacterium]|nr:efflux transporter outer membrane subunit [Planctomycetota bacterium]